MASVLLFDITPRYDVTMIRMPLASASGILSAGGLAFMSREPDSQSDSQRDLRSDSQRDSQSDLHRDPNAAPAPASAITSATMPRTPPDRNGPAVLAADRHSVQSRRRFLQSTAAAVAASVAPHARSETGYAKDTDTSPEATRSALKPSAPPTQPVTLILNGQAYHLQLEPRVTLLDALREYAGLTGTKKGCDRGQCGACTVIADGRRINACLSLAIMHDGESIVTVEGLATNHIPSPLQQAFIEKDAFQCGFCTPGQLCSATALLNEWQSGDASAVSADVRRRTIHITDAEIRERMSGNICRCGAYPNIVSAIQSVANPKT